MRIARSCFREHMRQHVDYTSVGLLTRLERLVNESWRTGWFVDIPLPFASGNSTLTNYRILRDPNGPAHSNDDYVVFVDDQNPGQSFYVPIHSGRLLAF